MSVRTNRKKKINSHVNPFKAVTALLSSPYRLHSSHLSPEGRRGRGEKNVYIYKSAFSFIIKMYHSSRTMCVLAAGYKCAWFHNRRPELHSTNPHEGIFFWISSFELEVSCRTFPGGGQIKARCRVNTPSCLTTVITASVSEYRFWARPNDQASI